jgi:hypothetical protein
MEIGENGVVVILWHVRLGVWWYSDDDQRF